MKKLTASPFLKTTSLFAAIIAVALLTSCGGSSNNSDDDDNDSGNGGGNEELTINNYLQIQTGQGSTYDLADEVTGLVEGDTFYGQDAHYLAGAAMSFQDNGDGTVTDLNTGLMWQQTPPNTGYSWDEAVSYTESLDLANHTDWRMPSSKELFAISDFSTGWPYIDLDYFDLASGEVTKDEQFWASDYYVGVTVEGGSNAAFGVNHVTGHIKAYAANVSGMFGNYVRAVRGGDYGTNEFVDNGDGTISDTASGLMWAQDDNGVLGVDWEDALTYAEDLELAGHNDWRLPNVKELQGIIDYSRSSTATDVANQGCAINPLFNCSDIINESGDDDFGYYWSSTSAYFSPASPGYYYAWYVAFGAAVNDDGDDFHGAGAVRFDTKSETGPDSEDAERYYNYVRPVRDID